MRTTSESRLSKEKECDLLSLLEGCRGVLTQLEVKLTKYENLGGNPKSLSSKFQRAWNKMKWDQDEIRELRDRITSNTTLLNAFNISLTR